MKTKKQGGSEERSAWSWLLEFAGDRRRGYALSVLFAVCNVICSVLPYVVLADVLRALFLGQDGFGYYVVRLGAMAALWVAAAMFHAFSTRQSHIATFNVLGTMRKRVCDKLARMPLGEVLACPSGALKNTLVERIDSIEPTLAHVVPEFTSNLLGPVLIFALLLLLDWRMAVVALVTIPIGLICMTGMFKDYDVNNQRCIDKTKVLNDTTVEYINGIEVIKVFGRTQSSYDKLVRAARDAAQSYVGWMRRCSAYLSMTMAIMPATLVTVLPVGGILVRSGSLAPEAFIECIVLSMGLVGPIIAVLSYSDDLAALRTVVGEVTAILVAPEQRTLTAVGIAPRDSTVELHDVCFSYGGKEVLHNVSLTMRAGEMTALVGPSGSGKSTIARLVARLWDVDAGSVAMGGLDVRSIDPVEYVKCISYVSQDCFLFDGTVRDNIRMGRSDATDLEVETIARAAGCHDFIMQLDRGYDTIVGSSGSHLSGGERQRVSIARAMLKDAPVVVLDEATAYADPENEALIEKSVGRLVRGKTLIVIAHRLQTICDAQHIAVIDDGRVVEEGTHAELLAAGGLYARMWESSLSVRDCPEPEGASHAVDA